MRQLWTILPPLFAHCSMYLSLDEITGYELEITSRCNANCPDCSRTTKKTLELRNIQLDDFKNWFTKKYVKNQIFDFCGTLGDASVHKDCLQFVEHLRNNDAKTISVVTNGSTRTPDWWKDLAKMSDVVFSIDGLEDTNHIYRKRTNWNKIMENVSAFIDAGGIATWEYLIFDHNEHQIEEARALAKKLKFSEIIFKKTARRFVLGKDTRSYESARNFEKIIQTYEIQCKWKKDLRVFVSAYDKLWPCCHWATSGQGIARLEGEYDMNFNNLNQYSIEEILNSNFFKNDLEASWESQNKYWPCALKCNVKTGNIEWRKNDRAVAF